MYKSQSTHLKVWFFSNTFEQLSKGTHDLFKTHSLKQQNMY